MYRTSPPTAIYFIVLKLGNARRHRSQNVVRLTHASSFSSQNYGERHRKNILVLGSIVTANHSNHLPFYIAYTNPSFQPHVCDTRFACSAWHHKPASCKYQDTLCKRVLRACRHIGPRASDHLLALHSETCFSFFLSTSEIAPLGPLFRFGFTSPVFTLRITTSRNRLFLLNMDA